MNWYGISVLCLALANVTRAQADPLVDFCRRWSHQTTVVDNKLFIYGGFVTYGSQIEEDTQNSTNSHLLYSDLGSVDQNTGMPIQYDLSKPSEVPVVSGGALWSDDVNKIFYLFGGQNDQQAQSPRQNTIWSYDILNNAWREMPTDSRSTDITIPAFGASTTDPNQGIGYYYGGWTDNSGGNAYSTAATAKSKMIVYEYESNIWHEIRFIDDIPRAEGALFYIPASDHGMLIYLGGVEQNVNGTYDGAAVDKINVFDIGSGVSYTQQTSGTPPAKRRRFCGGVTWPDDRSSYNIYLYGGLSPQADGGLGYSHHPMSQPQTHDPTHHGFPAIKDGNPYSANSYPSPVPSYHQAPSASPPLAGNWTPAQAFLSPPPPQGQAYYPTPPPPQLRDPSPGPVHEMPNVRSPTNVMDLQGPSPWKWRSPGGGIREE
ncbi:unnamed protein product [Zymoseptoria tritici ST99CH_1E4]|uniref:Uncharacterized protein n=1 Tax=Zymoseptoria tritici ST99CH_1E4 TaxID=1276532 RepID=A0A2H1FIS8_ZYMTR|nr:unnamed protein product [Zymoseptoria tritici ST99CH_1E4]